MHGSFAEKYLTLRESQQYNLRESCQYSIHTVHLAALFTVKLRESHSRIELPLFAGTHYEYARTQLCHHAGSAVVSAKERETKRTSRNKRDLARLTIPQPGGEPSPSTLTAYASLAAVNFARLDSSEVGARSVIWRERAFRTKNIYAAGVTIRIKSRTDGRTSCYDAVSSSQQQQQDHDHHHRFSATTTTITNASSYHHYYYYYTIIIITTTTAIKKARSQTRVKLTITLLPSRTPARYSVSHGTSALLVRLYVNYCIS